MDRVSAPNYITVSGKRMFQDINPGSGVLAGTELAAQWHNDVQESICLAQEVVGQASTEGDNTQLTKTIAALGAAGWSAPITASTAFTALQAGAYPVNAASGAINLTLPLAASMGGYAIRFRFSRTDSSVNAVNIVASGSDTFVGRAFTAVAAPVLAAGGQIELISDGMSKWMIHVLYQPRPYYKFTQSGTQAAAPNSSYNIASGTITLPAFSKTGAFRLNLRSVVEVQVPTASSSQQNFITTITDGTNANVGAIWLLTTVGGTLGTSDRMLTSNTYAPGAAVTLTMEVATAGGSGPAAWTIQSSFFEVFVEEA